MTDSQSVGETVLIVENDLTARELMATLMKRRGYRPVAAQNGAAALAMLAGWVNPDVIILDMLMPQVDGWKFLDAVRQSRHRDVPVVVMSGIGLTAEWATDHGCAGFLRKPFDDAELFTAIGRILKSSDAPRGSRAPAP